MNPPIVYRKPKGSRAASPSTSNIITNEAGPSKPKPVRKVISNSNESFIGRRKGTMPGPWLSFLDNILEGEDCEYNISIKIIISISKLINLFVVFFVNFFL